MADKNSRIAREVLEAVGGTSNVASVVHCITRLRMSLKDRSLADTERVKRISGVLGAQWSGGQYQVIIGQNVPKVYDEVLALGVNGGGVVDENLDGPHEPLTPARIGHAILNYLSKSMVTLIPIMLAAAMFRTIAVVAGPGMLGVWTPESPEYLLFYNWLYNAGFYFMPIYLGWSAARQLGASPQLGLMLGGVLVAPELMNLIQAAAQTGATTTSVYGIPAVLSNYANSVLPILLCMPVLWQVERFFKRVIPDMLSTVFVPFLTMVVMVPVSLCALAPLGGVLGSLLGTFMFGLGNTGGLVTIISLTLIAAFWEFLVVTGMHQVLILLGIAQVTTLGSDGCVMVAGGIAQFATWGMAFGAFLRLRNREERAAQLGYSLSGIVGGVTEPALYGCGFKYMRPFAGMVVGGAVGGLLAGIFGVTVHVLGATNILGILGFVGGGSTNLTCGVIASAAAFISAVLVTYFFGFSSEQLAEDKNAA